LPEWSYLTITDHPLDDIHPLGMLYSHEGNIVQASLFQTTLELVHASYKLPFVVFFNPEIHQVVFGLVKRRDEPQVDDLISDPYIRGIEPDSRHPELFNVSREPLLYIEEVCSFSAAASPSKVFLAQGLTNSCELNVFLFSQA